MPIEMKWISVEDELPSRKNGHVDDLVLVAMRNKNKSGGIFIQDVSAFDGGEWCKRPFSWEKITHWMPLPEPPKE